MNLIRKIIHDNNPSEPKLSEDDKKDVKRRLLKNESCASIARSYNMSQQSVSYFKNHRMHLIEI